MLPDGKLLSFNNGMYTKFGKLDIGSQNLCHYISDLGTYNVASYKWDGNEDITKYLLINLPSINNIVIESIQYTTLYASNTYNTSCNMGFVVDGKAYNAISVSSFIRTVGDRATYVGQIINNYNVGLSSSFSSPQSRQIFFNVIGTYSSDTINVNIRYECYYLA